MGLEGGAWIAQGVCKDKTWGCRGDHQNHCLEVTAGPVWGLGLGGRWEECCWAQGGRSWRPCSSHCLPSVPRPPPV